MCSWSSDLSLWSLRPGFGLCLLITCLPISSAAHTRLTPPNLPHVCLNIYHPRMVLHLPSISSVTCCIARVSASGLQSHGSFVGSDLPNPVPPGPPLLPRAHTHGLHQPVPTIDFNDPTSNAFTSCGSTLFQLSEQSSRTVFW